MKETRWDPVQQVLEGVKLMSITLITPSIMPLIYLKLTLGSVGICQRTCS